MPSDEPEGAGQKTARRKPTRSAHNPGALTDATRVSHQYADARGVWGVVPPPERSSRTNTDGNGRRKADAIRPQSRCFDRPDPRIAPVRRRAGRMAGRPPTRAQLKNKHSRQRQAKSRRDPPTIPVL